MLTDPPPNPLGGKTLTVDANDADSYPRPSAALLDAGEQDQVFAPESMKTKSLLQGGLFIWWGPVEMRCKYFPGVGAPSIFSKSQAVVSPASHFAMLEAISIRR